MPLRRPSNCRCTRFNQRYVDIQGIFVYTIHIRFQSLQCVPADFRRHRKGCEPWQPTVPQSNPAPNAARTPCATTISLTGCAQQASVRSSPLSCCSISAGRTCPIFLPRCSCPADYSFSSTLLSGTPAMPMWKRNGKPSCAILTAPLPVRRIMTMRFGSASACQPAYRRLDCRWRRAVFPPHKKRKRYLRPFCSLASVLHPRRVAGLCT